MTINQYKIKITVDEYSVMIISLFTTDNIDDTMSQEIYLNKYKDYGIPISNVDIEKVNQYTGIGPYFDIACDAIIYSTEFSS